MKRYHRKKAWALAGIIAVSLILLQACIGLPEDKGGIYYGTSGAALTMDMTGATDGDRVSAMDFHIKSVACASGQSFSHVERHISKELSALRIQGVTPAPAQQPSTTNARQLFSQYKVDLPAGCYSITVTPLTTTGDALGHCTPATKAKVKIDKGDTTRVSLRSRCAK